MEVLLKESFYQTYLLSFSNIKLKYLPLLNLNYGHPLTKLFLNSFSYNLNLLKFLGI